MISFLYEWVLYLFVIFRNFNTLDAVSRNKFLSNYAIELKGWDSTAKLIEVGGLDLDNSHANELYRLRLHEP